MTNAHDLLKSGDLAGALSAAKDEVRSKPAELGPRVLLFQLQCVIGDWAKAQTQLKVAPELDTEAMSLAQTYVRAIECEMFREDVFRGERSPLILGEPPEWMGLMTEALRIECQGDGAGAQAMREEALEKAPTTSGTLNGEGFDWVADADARLGPCLEVIVNGKYFWAPYERIRKLTIEPPTDLRDLIWIPAAAEWSNGGTAIALIPVRYPGSAGSDQDEIRLSRLTTWSESDHGAWTGLGQRVLTTSNAELPLLDVRELVTDVALT
ncbi:MAG: type VI secretion system accessory protein TagJ [Planctomycetota bacterium]